MAKFTIETSFGPVGVTLSRDGKRARPVAFIGAADSTSPWADLSLEGETVKLSGSLVMTSRKWATTGSPEGLRAGPGATDDFVDQVETEITAGLEEAAGADDPTHGENEVAYHRQQILELYETIGQHEARIATLRQKIAWHEEQIEPLPEPPTEDPPVGP